MLIPSWASFLLALVIILTLAITKKVDLWAGIFIGGLTFAILAELNVLKSFEYTFWNAPNLFLCMAVAIIPIIGAIMKDSGMMLELVRKLDVSKKKKFVLYPALMGLLNIPGGALFSAPLVDEIDKDLSDDKKIAINVWFRHVLILIYPLSATLVVSADLTGHSLVVLVGFLTIPMVVMVLVGFFTLIRGKLEEEEHNADLKVFFHHLIPVIVAPIIAFLGESLVPRAVDNTFIFVGIVVSLLILMNFADVKTKTLPKIAKNIKFWRFPLLIYAMLYFLEVFQISDVPEFIGSLDMSLGLYILAGLFLGYATGRVQLPVSILVPIYLSQYGLAVFPMFDFILVYCAIFMGYVCTPVHPCVSLTIEYFEKKYTSSIKPILAPTIICLVIIFALYGISML